MGRSRWSLSPGLAQSRGYSRVCHFDEDDDNDEDDVSSPGRETSFEQGFKVHFREPGGSGGVV